MEYTVLGYLRKYNDYVDITPFLIRKEFSASSIYDVLKDLSDRKMIETQEDPSRLNVSWGYLKELSYGEEDSEEELYGCSLIDLINRNDNIYLRITFEGKKEWNNRKTWAQRNTLLFSVIMAFLGSALTVIIKKVFHI